jgi:CRISPR/Cas system-associated endonuclease/helicase Cas3
VSFDELVRSILDGGSSQALCILNVKRHALEVFRRIRASGAEGVFHLSTSMCPAHRIKVLDEVRERLLDGRGCILVATQCVEAGVDLDFPSVYRAWGPLDSIAQASGRCNRNGKREYGELHVFELDDSAGRLYPDGSYQRASTVAKMLFREHGDPNLGIDDPEMFHRYFEMLYNVSDLESLNPELLEAMHRLDFLEVARLYQVIEKRAIDVLVPFDQAAYDDLARRARSFGLNRSWITNARAHSVSIFRPKPPDIVLGYLEPVPTRKGPSDDWFIYLDAEHYDPDAGLWMPDSLDCLIG